MLRGGPGDDSIRAADDSADTVGIFGNLDPDVIDGGPGDDRINVVAGGLDIVTYGLGKDTVFVGIGDVVGADCEDVRR